MDPILVCHNIKDKKIKTEYKETETYPDLSESEKGIALGYAYGAATSVITWNYTLAHVISFKTSDK